MDRILAYGGKFAGTHGLGSAATARPAVDIGCIDCGVGRRTLAASTNCLLRFHGLVREPSNLGRASVRGTARHGGWAIPLAPGGLGAQEYVLDELFKQLPNQPEEFSGMIVATVYRLITLAIAGIGLVYYWTSHGRELKQVRQEAEEFQRETHPTASPP